MSAASERIRALNDTFRTTYVGGNVMLTRGVAALPPDAQLAITRAVQSFNDFTPDNDPYGEHDFGSIEYSGERIFWKIDCYNKALEAGSENPADPTVTTRVLTIMLAEEY